MSCADCHWVSKQPSMQENKQCKEPRKTHHDPTRHRTKRNIPAKPHGTKSQPLQKMSKTEQKAQSTNKNRRWIKLRPSTLQKREQPIAHAPNGASSPLQKPIIRPLESHLPIKLGHGQVMIDPNPVQNRRAVGAVEDALGTQHGHLVLKLLTLDDDWTGPIRRVPADPDASPNGHLPASEFR